MGEHTIDKDPDCSGRRLKNCPSSVTRHVGKIKVHENYTKENNLYNDIALIRLDKAVTLFDDDPRKSVASPVCLPLEDYKLKGQ